MNRECKTIACLVAALSLAGCETLEGSERAGRIGGAVVGGLVVGLAVADQSGLAAGLVGGAAGAVLGSFAGKRIARNIFERDLRARSIAYRRAMDQYAQSGWRNPDTGSSGEIVRTSGKWRQGQETCARFQERYAPAGDAYPAIETTSCMSADTWRVV